MSETIGDAAALQHKAVDEVASELIGLASNLALTIGTAESCTGGMIAAVLTSIPGSSETFKGSVVCYSNEVKTALLGVDGDIIARNGAVDEEVALQMAIGLRKALNVDYAVSATGIAGPDGGSEEKPVGMVWIAVAGCQGNSVRLYHFKGGRAQIREATVREALLDLKACIQRQFR